MQGDQDEPFVCNVPNHEGYGTHVHDTRGAPLVWYRASVMEPEKVNHPNHYNQFPVECIDIVEHMTFNQGNAIKYLWRMNDKSDPITDLRKAIWYAEREIERLQRATPPDVSHS